MLKGIHQQLEPQDTPAFFVRGPKTFPRLMFYCSVSLLMMAADARFDYLNQLRQAFSVALYPLEALANAPNEWGRNINTYFTTHNHLIQENFKLREQAVFDHAALQRLATVDAENAHLRSLLTGDAPIIPDATLGEVMHMGRDPFSNIIAINRGSQHHITPGQAVVDAEGVVGQVTRVYPFTSEVTLITDKKLSVPIQIERNQLRAIAFGEGKRNTLDIPYLPTSVDIKVGDKLVTSGIDGVYPAGLAVATVTQIKQSQDSPFARIISKPLAGVNNHRHILILKLPATPSNVTSNTISGNVTHSANTEHLDQSVVQVLQQHNAQVDPVVKSTPIAEADVAVANGATDNAQETTVNPELKSASNANNVPTTTGTNSNKPAVSTEAIAPAEKQLEHTVTQPASSPASSNPETSKQPSSTPPKPIQISPKPNAHAHEQKKNQANPTKKASLTTAPAKKTGNNASVKNSHHEAR